MDVLSIEAGRVYMLNVTDNSQALNRVGILSLQGDSKYDGLFVQVRKVSYATEGRNQRVYIRSADPGLETKYQRQLERYHWPPECFAYVDDYTPPKIVKRNVFNLWPGMKGNSND